MPTGATKKTTRRRTPKVIPAESPNGKAEAPEPVEDEWASAESLSVKGYRDELLPVMKQKVRIRFITNIEATQLALLPDLQAFANLMTQLESSKSALTPDEDRALRVERMTYLTRVAHMAVVDPKARKAPEPCVYCEGLEHPPSLWTPEQTKYLHPTDLGVIGTVAERGFELERVRPLSRARTPKPTSQPASTGESIPDPTS
jgi:hypothetical protein